MLKRVWLRSAAAAVLLAAVFPCAQARPQAKTKITQSSSGETSVSTGPAAGLGTGRSEGGGGITSGPAVHAGHKPASFNPAGGVTRGAGGGVSGGTLGGGSGGGGGTGGGGTGGGGSSSPKAVPASCFGRQVVWGDGDSQAYMASNKNEGFGGNYRNHNGRMHVLQFKTDKAGYWVNIRIVFDADYVSGFISPVPCDYTWASQNNTIKEGYGAWDLPVLNDAQFNEIKKRQKPFDQWYGYNYRLLPNTYYYFHAMNVSGLAGIKNDAQLTAAPETCQGDRGNGDCYYLILMLQNKFHVGGPAPIP